MLASQSPWPEPLVYLSAALARHPDAGNGIVIIAGGFLLVAIAAALSIPTVYLGFVLFFLGLSRWFGHCVSFTFERADWR